MNERLLTLVEQNPAPAAVTAVALLVLVAFAIHRTVRAFGRLRARVGDEQLLTVATSTIATGVAAQGMWGYFETLHIPVWLRVLFFAFLELMVVTSALRARTSMREGHGTGADGIAMWVLTCLSAVLSATHAASPGEVLLRLSAPLVAAWGWERSMALERRQRTGRAGINWRISPERMLVRLGLADPTDRTASEVDTHRRLLRLAIATRRTQAASGPRRWWLTKRLNRAMEGAVEYGGLGTDPTSQATLTTTLGALVNTAGLMELRPAAPWDEQPARATIVARVVEPDGGLVELGPGSAGAPVEFDRSQPPSTSTPDAGHSVAHTLDEAIRAAKADGLVERDLAANFDVSRHRVRKALKPTTESTTEPATTEAGDIDASTGSAAGEEPVTEPQTSTRGRRFGMRLHRWLFTAEEAPPLHAVNGHRPECA
ncbi:hypothetical protein [Streptomyces sp.]|uniref:hypothetical protein n=1 Tax=Streptomyces sp. TaxID=1931 RepID=UPI002F9400D7